MIRGVLFTTPWTTLQPKLLHKGPLFAQPTLNPRWLMSDQGLATAYGYTMKLLGDTRFVPFYRPRLRDQRGNLMGRTSLAAKRPHWWLMSLGQHAISTELRDGRNDLNMRRISTRKPQLIRWGQL